MGLPERLCSRRTRVVVVAALVVSTAGTWAALQHSAILDGGSHKVSADASSEAPFWLRDHKALRARSSTGHQAHAGIPLDARGEHRLATFVANQLVHVLKGYKSTVVSTKVQPDGREISQFDLVSATAPTLTVGLDRLRVPLIVDPMSTDELALLDVDSAGIERAFVATGTGQKVVDVAAETGRHVRIRSARGAAGPLAFADIEYLARLALSHT